MKKKSNKIYSLSHPITGEVRYIGFTSNKLSERLSGHLCDIKRSSNRKNNWLKSLISQNLKPVIELVEDLGNDPWEEAEKYWIQQFKNWGFRLTNNEEGGIGAKRTERIAKSIKKLKPIKQYSLDGNFIREWSSATEVNNSLGYSKVVICKAIKNKTTASGFQWRYKEDNSTVDKWTGMNKRKVHQYSLDGKFIKEWSAVVEASKTLTINSPGIFKNLRGDAKSAGGFIWKYFNDTNEVIIKKDRNGYSKRVIIEDTLNTTTNTFERLVDAANYLNITSKALWAFINTGKGNKGKKYNLDNKKVYYAE